MKTISYKKSKINISDDAWSRHCQMHPIRSEEALVSNLKVVFGSSSPSSADVEKTIYEEYEMQEHFADILEEAEVAYDIINSKD